MAYHKLLFVWEFLTIFIFVLIFIDHEEVNDFATRNRNESKMKANYGKMNRFN